MSSMIYDSELLTHIFDTVDVGVAVCNAKDNLLESVNNTFAKIHGYEQHELFGISPKDVFAPDCIAKLNDYEQKLNHEENTLSFETVHFKKDGTPVKISAHFTLLKDENGQVQKRVVNIIDISGCKNKKCVFQDTNSKLQAMFATIPDMVWMKDPNGKYITSNHTFNKVFEKTEYEVIGKTDYDFFSKEEADSCKISDLDAIKVKDTIICQEIISYPKSGTKGILEIRKTPVYDSYNNLMGILGIARDVTERKKAEEQLLIVNTAINATSEAIYITDIDLSIIYVNDGACNMLGYTKDEFVSMKVSDIEAKYSSKEVLDIKNTIEGTNQIVFESKHKTKYGKIIDVEITGSSFVFEGQVVRISVVKDITDRLKTQKQLLKTTTQLKALIATIPDLVWMKDINGIYMTCNPAFEEFFGAKEEEIVGKTDYDFVDKELADFFRQKDKEAIEKGMLNINEEVITYKSTGLQGILETRKAPVYDKNGEIIGVLGIAKDITERKKFEERLVVKQQELKNSEEMFRTLTENLPDNIVRWDLEGRYLYINPRHEKTLEMSAEEVIGNKMCELFDTHTNVSEALEYVIKTGEGVFGVLQDIEYSDGTQEIHEVNIIPELDNNGQMISILGIGRDITKQVRLQEELKKQKDFQDTLLKGVAKAGMSVNVLENGRYIYTNNIELAKEYGYDDNFLENKPNFLETIHPDDKEKVAQMYQKRLSGEQVPTTYTIRQINKQGETKEHEISVVLIPNTNPVQTLVVNKDVTEQKNIEKRIEFMAHHDILTGLPNRVLLKDRAEMILSQAKRNIKKTAFLFIDLDGFKTINDSLGHSIGDIILKSVAQRIQSCIRATDTLSRYGGDEFIVIIPEVNNQDEAELVSEKIINEFKKSFEINNQLLSITASVGIAMYPEHGNNFEHLLQNSDAAMYKAKENGKNTYCFFTQQMKHNLLGIFKMQNDLKEAIRNKEFILHYQPQVDLSQNKIVGAEALIRWKHPSMGMIPPMNFISVAESCGYIVEIGEWVIQEACRQGAIWNKNGKDIVVAVNVSAVQFRRGNLIEVVKNALSSSGLNPKYLELELTESILISDTDNVLQSVKAIKELGVQLSIDDFGTGYSSLAYLKRFAVDKLKIDQSFVRDIVKDKEDASIVKTIIQMAKSFNLKSIAEGVENEEVLNVLKEFECDEVQGYYFAKPMIADDFQDYYKKLATI